MTDDEFNEEMEGMPPEDRSALYKQAEGYAQDHKGFWRANKKQRERMIWDTMKMMLKAGKQKTPV